MNIFKKAVLLSFICVASISSVIITPALPQLKHSFHLNDGQLQWVVSIFLLGYITGQLIYGPLSNRIGTVKALRLGFSVNIIGIVLCLLGVWQMNYVLLLSGRLVSALGSAAGLACTFILIKQLLAEGEAKQAMSYSIVSFSLGIGLAVSVGGFLTQYLHWQYCFWVLLAHGLIMLLCTWLFSSKTKSIKIGIKHIIRGYLIALRSKQLIYYSLFVGLSGVVAYCYSAAAPLISASFLRLSPAQYGLWNFLNIIGMFASGIFAAKLIKSYEMKKIIQHAFFGVFVAIIFLFLLWFTADANPVWFFVSTMLLYFFTGIIFPCAAFYATNAIKDSASASSMMSFINMSSAALCVVFLGHLPFSFLLDFVVVLVGFVLLIIFLGFFVKLN